MTIEHNNEPLGNEVRRRSDAIIGKGQGTFTPSLAVVNKALGCRLWTIDGLELIDFTSGVLVTNLGHAHPLFESLQAEYARFLPRSSYNMLTTVEVRAAERLIASAGFPKAERVLYAASGSEGIQKAMWAAMHKHPDRPILLATRHGFHGKKGLAGEVTGFESTNPNVRFISFPMEEERPSSFYEAELDQLAAEYPNQIALLITEPYLGAAGSFHPPAWYHQLLQRWCEAHDVAFIFDEVQSCFGRTGNMYAFQTYGIEPDLVVLGKGLASGEPAAAVLGRADLIDSLDYGEASDTFSGTPRACAAICATLDVFERENVVENCRKMSVIVRRGFERLMARFPFIKAVRGEGLVFGIEIQDRETALQCVLAAYKGDGKSGVHFLGPLAGKVLRVSPPLVITEDEVNEAIARLESAWASLA